MVRSTRMGKKESRHKKIRYYNYRKKYVILSVLLLLSASLALAFFNNQTTHVFSDSSSPGARTKPNNIKVGRFISQRRRSGREIDSRRERTFCGSLLVDRRFAFNSPQEVSFRSYCERAHKCEQAGKLALIGWSFEIEVHNTHTTLASRYRVINELSVWMESGRRELSESSHK